LPRLSVSLPTKVLTVVLVTVMVVFGVAPSYLLEVARAAARMLM
jgi:Sec-independent protein translocase protein TatA